MRLYIAAACTPWGGEMMKVYMAGDNGYGKGKGNLLNNIPQLNRVNLLESFFYIRDWQIPLIHKVKSFILDSGAFSFIQNKNLTQDWDSYLDRYIDFINTNNIELFFELDIDSVIGYDKVLKMTKRLEAKTGKQPIWVLQQGRSKELFIASSKEYQYIAIPLSGGNRYSNFRRNQKSNIDSICDIAHSNGTKIHGLGFTKCDLIDYKFDSVDSTAWVYGNRGGFLYHFNGKNIIKINKPEGKRLKGKEVAIHNFWEWVKYGEYLENINVYQAETCSREYVVTGGG